jgi:uncharacterized protein (DUF4415 family)
MSRRPNPELIDDENPAWTEEMIREARPAAEVVPKIVEAHRRGRPVKEDKKRQLTLRLSPEVVDYFKSTGSGWQTRLDEALKEYVETHR